MRCLSLRHSAGDKHLPYSPEPNLSSVLFILRQQLPRGSHDTHTQTQGRGERRECRALRNVFLIKVTYREDDLVLMDECNESNENWHILPCRDGAWLFIHRAESNFILSTPESFIHENINA